MSASMYDLRGKVAQYFVCSVLYELQLDGMFCVWFLLSCHGYCYFMTVFVSVIGRAEKGNQPCF